MRERERERWREGVQDSSGSKREICSTICMCKRAGCKASRNISTSVPVQNGKRKDGRGKEKNRKKRNYKLLERQKEVERETHLRIPCREMMRWRWRSWKKMYLKYHAMWEECGERERDREDTWDMRGTHLFSIKPIRFRELLRCVVIPLSHLRTLLLIRGLLLNLSLSLSLLTPPPSFGPYSSLTPLLVIQHVLFKVRGSVFQNSRESRQVCGRKRVLRRALLPPYGNQHKHEHRTNSKAD